MNKKTLATLAAFALIGVSLTGCSQQTDSSGNSPPPKGQQDITAATTPVIQPALTAWQQGDKATAVSRFLETDWSARPLFKPGSTLSMSEEQFKSLAETDASAAIAKSSEITAQVGELRQLALAVAEAGRAAAAKKDVAQAVKAFTALKQFSEALDRPESPTIVQLTGRLLKKRADGELAKLKQ
jgi:hypothetical protein